MAYPPNQMPPAAQMPSSRSFVGGNTIEQLAAMKANKGESLQAVPPMEQVPMNVPPDLPMQQGTGIPMDMPVFVPEQNRGMLPASPTSNWGQDLRTKVAPLAAATLAEKGLSSSIVETAERDQEREQNEQRIINDSRMPSRTLQNMAMNNRAIESLNQSAENPIRAMEDGGLIGMALGGEFAGRVPGRGHGMEDNVRMPIKEDNKQIAELAVSPSEYVVDSHTMAALGNGNADRGADVMDATVKQIRQKAYGTEKQPNEISGLAALKPLIERV